MILFYIRLCSCVKRNSGWRNPPAGGCRLRCEGHAACPGGAAARMTNGGGPARSRSTGTRKRAWCFGRDLERSGEFHEYCDPDTGQGMDDKRLKAEPAGQRQHRREA